MSIRRSVLASLIAGIVFISAAPAWAVYTKFVNVVDFDSGDNLKVTGRLILDDEKNPDPLPTDGEKCPKGRVVKVQKERAGGSWRTVGQTTTDNQGHFSEQVEDKNGSYRLKAPSAQKGKAFCYSEKKEFHHSH